MKKITIYISILLYTFILSTFIARADNDNDNVANIIANIPNTRLAGNNNYVSNRDAIVSNEDVVKINTILRQLEDSTNIQVAVVAVNELDESILTDRELAFELYNEWGIGREEYDDGLLILLITDPDTRSIAFEVGYGLEEKMTDIICKHIQVKYMYPLLTKDKFSEGLVEGVKAVHNFLSDKDFADEIITEVNEESQYFSDTATETEPFKWTDILLEILYGILFILIIAAPVLIIYFLVYFIQRIPRKCPNCGKVSYRYQKTDIIKNATEYETGLKHKHYSCKCGYKHTKKVTISKVSSSSSSSSSGSGSSWGGGGGGGSWGGGSSGGGGASTRF